MISRLLLALALALPWAANLSPIAPKVIGQVKQDAKQRIVYATRTGHRYHRAGCRYLKYSSIKMTRREAEARGLTPCGVCRP